jgi:hypothetical protein
VRIWLARRVEAGVESKILQHLDDVARTLREDASAHIHAGVEVIGIIDGIRALRAAAPFTLERVIWQHAEAMTDGESHRRVCHAVQWLRWQHHESVTALQDAVGGEQGTPTNR